MKVFPDAGRRRRTVYVAIVDGVVIIAGSIVALAVLGSRPNERGVAALRHAVPPGDEWAGLDRVSQWPTDWTSAVCRPPVYWLKAENKDLPHATRRGVCQAKIAPAGEYFDVTLARFNNELEMQVDLQNYGYEAYAFAYDQGGLLVYAISGSVQNMDITAVLEPLERYGFNVYHDPGP
ncbi:hypothetical protein [Mycolicibacterium sp. YH-1]|uniref:hypothetical protein n=1 Tax=Mycolicibacterium sp. YH-1 TaxID=2908837 RepID=UPI001F4C1CB8|nr:hypothetical protein [Mycolicibacterium sp. YH-1]UNB52639.1 hypothetical protein L0M16_33185 [Mycolicibacterium sp. YH-1]